MHDGLYTTLPPPADPLVHSLSRVAPCVAPCVAPRASHTSRAGSEADSRGAAHGLGAADGGATARTCGDVRPSAACGLPAARAPATSAEASRLLPELRAVLPPAPFQLRGSQARLCVPLGEGRDYLGVAATGSGKSVILFVSAFLPESTPYGGQRVEYDLDPHDVLRHDGYGNAYVLNGLSATGLRGEPLRTRSSATTACLMAQ